jgi:ribosomal protein L1
VPITRGGTEYENVKKNLYGLTAGQCEFRNENKTLKVSQLGNVSFARKGFKILERKRNTGTETKPARSHSWAM